jgi:hypothetical protein
MPLQVPIMNKIEPNPSKPIKIKLYTILDKILVGLCIAKPEDPIITRANPNFIVLGNLAIITSNLLINK